MNKLNLYHKLLAVVAIHVCLWILLVHGWMGYATITERAGLRYIIYLFKGLNKVQYTTYNFAVAFLALQLIAIQIYYLVEKRPKPLIYTYIAVMVLGIVIFLAELYFETRFIPQG